MLILEAGNVKKYYKDRLIIEFDGLKLYSGDKVGIVGQNGSGKTTLMNILSKDIDPDEGFVKQYCDIAYIRQFSDDCIAASPKALKEFKLTGIQNQDVFSGGEKTRIRIANIFSKDHPVLFADEPTANLDYKGIELLRQKLSEVSTFLLISHDRSLLDSLCNKILEVRDGRIKIYNGNYSFYKDQSEMERQYGEQEYEKYAAEKARLEGAIRERAGKSKALKKTPKRMGNSEARLHKRSTNEIQEKIDGAGNILKTRLEKLEVKEKPRELPQIKLDFSLTRPPENKIVISADNLTFGYGSRKIFQHARFKVYNGLKTALWGENGAGKTTLLNMIAQKSNEDIYIVPKATIGYFCQGLENLDNNKTVLENVMADSVQTQTAVRTILARLLISGDDVYKKVGVLSGGERIKVSFSKLLVSNANVLLMDEPTNFLDMMSIEALENVLREYEGTVLFVSHDRAFVNSVADRLLMIANQSIAEFDGTLQEYMNGSQKSGSVIKNEAEQMVLQMRITEIVAKLSRGDGDREALEAEYQSVLSQLQR